MVVLSRSPRRRLSLALFSMHLPSHMRTSEPRPTHTWVHYARTELRRLLHRVDWLHFEKGVDRLPWGGWKEIPWCSAGRGKRPSSKLCQPWRGKGTVFARGTRFSGSAPPSLRTLMNETLSWNRFGQRYHPAFACLLLFRSARVIQGACPSLTLLSLPPNCIPPSALFA